MVPKHCKFVFPVGLWLLLECLCVCTHVYICACASVWFRDQLSYEDKSKVLL